MADAEPCSWLFQQNVCLSSAWDSMRSPLQTALGWELGQTSQTRTQKHRHGHAHVQIKLPQSTRSAYRPMQGCTKKPTNCTDTEKWSHTHTLYSHSHSDWATFPNGMGSSLDWKTNITPSALWIRSTLGISHWDREMKSGRMSERRREEKRQRMEGRGGVDKKKGRTLG